MIKIYPDNPNQRSIEQVCEVLRGGGIVIYPTDSLYAWGCSVKSAKGVEKLKGLTGKSEKELTLLCSDLSQVAEYAKVDNSTFKLLKRHTPGAVTFILTASGRVPDKILERRKSIGVRIPDNNITLEIIKELGGPLLSGSVKPQEDADIEYTTDPELIDEMFGQRVDLIVDGGIGDYMATTLVDVTSGEVELIREGRIEVEI